MSECMIILFLEIETLLRRLSKKSSTTRIETKKLFSVVAKLNDLYVFLFARVAESESKVEAPRLLIIDARSYAAAVANRAKGGGCECQGKTFRRYCRN